MRISFANRQFPHKADEQLQVYGQTFIHDDFFLATINSFAAAANCLSRIFWGAFADRVGTRHLMNLIFSIEFPKNCVPFFHYIPFSHQSSYQITMNIACASGAILMWTLGLVELLASRALFFIWVSQNSITFKIREVIIPFKLMGQWILEKI